MDNAQSSDYSFTHNIIEEEENISSSVIEINASQSLIKRSSNALNSNQLYHRSDSSPFELYFLIEKKKLKQDLGKVAKLCPLITKVLEGPQSKELRGVPLVIDLPSDITVDALKNFYSYDISPDFVLKEDLIEVLIIAEYFENHDLASRIVRESILPSLNASNAVRLLLIAAKKGNLNVSMTTTITSEQRGKTDTWGELTQSAKEFLHKHLELISKADLNQLMHFDGKLFNEILQNYCYTHNCFYNSSILNDSQAKLIKSIEVIYNCGHLLQLIQALYTQKFSPSELEELITATLPVMIELRETYQEYEVNLDEKDKTIIVSTSFSASDQKCNVTINPSNINSCYMHSVLYINDTKERDAESLLTNFSKWSNYSINAFNNSHLNSKKRKKFFIHIRLDYTFTSLVNYLLNHLDEYSRQFHLISCDISLITQIVLNAKANNINQNLILTAIMDWLNNGANSSESNVISLSEQVNWRDIKTELIAEFFIKYSAVLKKTLSNTLMKIFKDNKIDKVISHLTKSLGATPYTAPNFKHRGGCETVKTVCSSVVSLHYLANSNNKARMAKKELSSCAFANDETGNTYYSTFTSQIAALSPGKNKHKNNTTNFYSHNNAQTPKSNGKSTASLYTDMFNPGVTRGNVLSKK